MSFRVRSLAVISCASLLWVGADSAQAVIIDSFTTAPVLSTQQTTTTVSGTLPELTTETGLSDVYAERRGAGVVLQSAAVTGFDHATIQIAPSAAGGIFDYTSSVGANGRFGINYLGNVSSPGTDPDLDFLSELIEIDVLAYDAPLLQPYEVAVVALNGNSTVATSTVLYSTAGTLQIVWTNIVDVNMQADALEFYFDIPSGGDIRLGEIRTVPVPEPTAVGALALGGMMMLRRRR